MVAVATLVATVWLYVIVPKGLLAAAGPPGSSSASRIPRRASSFKLMMDSQARRR
jgi:hypothetical protein